MTEADPHQPISVIYADDDPRMRDLVSALLLDHGIDIHACETASEALVLFDRIHPDVVVLDLDMPNITGFEAARRIRERDAFGRTRLIALTGLGVPDLLGDSARAGFDEFLKKPVSGSTLLRALGIS